MPYPTKITVESILDGAAGLVDEGGLDALSTRLLAGRLGVRAPSLYRYFPDKEDLVRALGARFQAELRVALAPCSGDLAEFARAYRGYALAHPRRYEAIFRAAPERERPPRETTLRTAEPLLELATRLDPVRPLPTARAVLSYLHGAVSIQLAGHTREGIDPDEAFDLGLRALERGLAHP
jgi:AcrR family transcriptional regulator